MGTRVLLRSWPIIRALFRKSKIRVDSGALPAVSFEKSSFLFFERFFFLFLFRLLRWMMLECIQVCSECVE